MGVYDKIIKCGYDGQQAGSCKGRIKTSFLLGVLLFALNLFLILFISIHNMKNKNDVVVMLQGDSVAAQEIVMEAGSGKENNSASLITKTGTKSEVSQEESSEADSQDTAKQNADIKKVYLTFDDGPSKNTEEILDILKKYDVKATFFVVGKKDEYSRQMYQRIVKEGHTLGMHSYSHNYQEIYKSKKAFEKDLDKIQKLLYDVTKEKCIYYRFPGGSSNTVSSISMKNFIRILTKKGIVYYDWNVVSGDAEGKNLTMGQMVQNVLKDVDKYHTSIVLMHDASSKIKTAKMLPILLKKLKKEGVSILPICDDTKLVQHVKLES